MTSTATTKRPVRILRLLSRMNVGGPSLHVLHLTREMSVHGFETCLAVGEPRAVEGSMIGLAHAVGVKPIIIPGLDRPINPVKDFRAFVEILRLIHDFKPDIVHSHTAKAGILGRLAAVLCRVPVIVHTFHGHVFEGYFSAGASRGIMALERLLARLSDIVITLSPHLCDDLLRHLRIPRSQKVRVVPLGLDLSPFLAITRRPVIRDIRNHQLKKERWRDTLSLSPDAVLLGVVARLVPVKNHLGLIDAFAQLASEDPRLHLAIVGGGEMEMELRATVEKHKLSEHIHFMGIQSDIARVYSDLDLLVLSSLNEGTPVVLIEALAAGCPVAATNVGGVSEILDYGRLGVILRSHPQAFVEDLRSAISRLPELEAAAGTGRRAIQERFRIDRLVERISDLYDEVLSRRNPAMIKNRVMI
ncbi:MAG: glycosyltransferase [Candidatus Riflebacteria bacterium]|nr:glycosyltransferase [Candidatus Riflebacteria bacterium]